MSFDGTEGTFINSTVGGGLTGAFREKFPNTRTAVFYGKEKLQDLLAQSDCQGIRVYFGWNETNEVMELVLVGADSNEDDILENILDCGIPCPNNCSSSNALNS